MWPNPQETADFVAFTEEIFNRKLHFLPSARIYNLHEKKNPARKSFINIFLKAFTKSNSQRCFYIYTKRQKCIKDIVLSKNTVH